MATVNKDFRVKNGLVVEGTTGTINGNNIITDGDDTDVLDEGTTNLYYTDQRVKDVLTGSAQTNISITDEEGTLTIVAENGVDDSTTDDLDEGDVNLYYTDERVYSKAKSAITAGTGIDVTNDDEAETLTIDVDTEEIATVTYVNEVAQGLKVRGNVEAATTENLTGTYDNGVDGVDATLNLGPLATFEVDGWSDWEVNDGILVKDQTNAFENGRYFIFQVGDATTDWILKRCVRCDESEEIPGSYVFVQHGTQYGVTGWVATVDNLGTFTVGVDDINWVQFSGAGTFTGGTGIDIDGQEISIDFTEFDTDDIDEGETNLYYTDQRVEDVIANSDTDDLAEGSTNLYFTDQRAVDALEAVTPNFTEIEINSVSKQVAASILVDSDTGGFTAYSFDPAEYRSAKFLVKAAFGSHTQISEILLTLDTSDNISITEYAIVTTNGILVDISADQSGGQILLIANAENANTTVTVFGTLIA
jgi:hypothetical protein